MQAYRGTIRTRIKRKRKAGARLLEPYTSPINSNYLPAAINKLRNRHNSTHILITKTRILQRRNHTKPRRRNPQKLRNRAIRPAQTLQLIHKPARTIPTTTQPITHTLHPTHQHTHRNTQSISNPPYQLIRKLTKTTTKNSPKINTLTSQANHHTRCRNSTHRRTHPLINHTNTPTLNSAPMSVRNYQITQLINPRQQQLSWSQEAIIIPRLKQENTRIRRRNTQTPEHPQHLKKLLMHHQLRHPKPTPELSPRKPQLATKITPNKATRLPQPHHLTSRQPLSLQLSQRETIQYITLILPVITPLTKSILKPPITKALINPQHLNSNINTLSVPHLIPRLRNPQIPQTKNIINSKKLKPRSRRKNIVNHQENLQKQKEITPPTLHHATAEAKPKPTYRRES